MHHQHPLRKQHKSHQQILEMSLDYQYDALGQITNMLSSKGRKSQFTYDDFNRLVSEQHYSTTGDKTIDNTYTYDPSGNRLSKSSLWGTVNYSYGTGNRLTTWNCENATNAIINVSGSSSETINTKQSGGSDLCNTIFIKGIYQISPAVGA